MWGSFDPFAQIKKRASGFGRRRKQEFENFFGHSHGGNNNGWGNNNNNNNGWGENNGWGDNNGRGQNNNNGWGNTNNNNGWESNNNNNGWENNQNKGWGNQNNNIQGGGGLWGNALEGVNWIYQMQKRHQSNVKPFQIGDIKKFIEQQIILIEPSPHQKKLEELKKTGQTFKDDRFPANLRSLTGQFGNVSQWVDIKWTAVTQAIPGSKIFVDKVGPQDIAQGYLGDCYFLAALAAIAERADRIFQLFLINEVNQQKYFSVKMLFKGKWMTIDMDQYIPFLDGKPAFSKAKSSQLWVVLLEKAWAKLYSSYKRIEAGFPEQGLHDLTGAPVRQISLHSANFNKEKEWNYLLDASKRQYAMVSSSQAGSDTQKSVSGVVQGHAYTFLQAINLNFKGQIVRLVQLRNPWGKGQFKGAWSDSDSNWNYVDAAQKARVGFNLDTEDGIFFMPYDEYIKQFRSLTVAEVDDNASYLYKSHYDPQRKGCYFKVTIHKEGNYSFHVDKTPQRVFEDSVQNQYQYPIAQLSLGQLQGNQVVGKKGISSGQRTLYYDADLKPGQYIAFVRIDFDPQFEKQFDVNLAIYAEFACEIKLASRVQAIAHSGNSNVAWTGQEGEKGEWNQMNAWGGGANNNSGLGQQSNNNNGWPQQGNNNNGWPQQGNNNGWPQQGNNNGWPQQDNNNKQNNNNGWGYEENSVGHNVGHNGGYHGQYGGNNSWGNQPNNNNGWGNQNNGW